MIRTSFSLFGWLSLWAAWPALAQVAFDTRLSPDAITQEPAGFLNMGMTFYPAFVPESYTAAQISQVLQTLAPQEKHVFWQQMEWENAGERLASARTVVTPGSWVHGQDFTGNPFDETTWQAAGPGEITLRRDMQRTLARKALRIEHSETLERPRSGSATVDVHIWTGTQLEDTVETTAATLRYSPETVPEHIPESLVQQALNGGTPGSAVALATGRGTLGLGPYQGSSVETVEAFGPVYGVDFFGDPDNHLTWFAIGDHSILVNAKLISKHGTRRVNQTLHYQIEVPDATGEIIRNPLQRRVETVEDAAVTLDKIYFTPDAIPEGLDAGAVAALAAKVPVGGTALARLETADTYAAASAVSARELDGRGATAGVDYSGNPADPATWNALTAKDVIVDEIEHWTVTTPVQRTRTIHQLYHPSPNGKLTVTRTPAIGHDITKTTRFYLDVPIDPAQPPVEVSGAQIAQALAWAAPGETVVAAQTIESTLLSETSEPLPSITDTNGWVEGTDYATGGSTDPAAWTSLNGKDVFIDVYEVTKRTRVFREVAVNYLVTAPTPSAGGALNVTIERQPGPHPAVLLRWQAPPGLVFGVLASPDLAAFTPSGASISSDTFEYRHIHYFSPDDPMPERFFFRITRP